MNLSLSIAEDNKYKRSKKLFKRALKLIPGGVNSPVRSFKSVGGNPVFIKEARGAYLYDEDGNRYIDYINSWGCMILGHAHKAVTNAICKRVKHATSFGTPTEIEVKMAELIKSMVPGIDMIRMVNSGTEACMSALRLARAYTGRNKFIKFEGCYHGHSDSFLIGAGSGMATLGLQAEPGVTNAVASDTLTATFNDIDSVNQIMLHYPNQIAAIIVEPVAGNMGCIPPEKSFLKSLRKLCTQHGIVLIFDEVMTGFRLAPGGAQELFNVQADLVTYGKIIGGGLPVGAFGGRKHLMQNIAPQGKVYQAGTLSGNPLAMTAGYTMLNFLKNNSQVYTKLENTTLELSQGISGILRQKGIEHVVNRVGSMMSLHFGSQAVTNFQQAKSANISQFNRFFHHMLKWGIHLPPSAFESWFISTEIGPIEIETTLRAVKSFEP